MTHITDLKFISESFKHSALKCDVNEKSEMLNVKKEMGKGNTETARIYADIVLRKRNEQKTCIRLDAIIARLETHVKIQTIGNSMASVVKTLDSSLETVGNLQKMSGTMDRFEKQGVDMEVQAEFVEGSMAGLSRQQGQVNSLMQQVADDHRLEVSAGLPWAAAHTIQLKVDEEHHLLRRLAELKATQ